MSNSDTSPKSGQRVTLPTLYFTHDETRIEHIISDETLMQIAQGGRDISLPISTTALGVAMGYFQNFVSVVAAMRAGLPVDNWDGAGSGIFLVAATTFLIAIFSYRRTKFDMNALIARIRNRKVGVMAEPGRPFAGGEPFPGDPSISTDTSSTIE
jgi:hypothetical protein